LPSQIFYGINFAALPNHSISYPCAREFWKLRNAQQLSVKVKVPQTSSQFGELANSVLQSLMPVCTNAASLKNNNISRYYSTVLSKYLNLFCRHFSNPLDLKSSLPALNFTFTLDFLTHSLLFTSHDHYMTCSSHDLLLTLSILHVFNVI